MFDGANPRNLWGQCVCESPTPIWAPSLLVTQLVGDGEGEREPSVLVDAAAAVGLTHACHMG